MAVLKAECLQYRATNHLLGLTEPRQYWIGACLLGVIFSILLLPRCSLGQLPQVADSRLGVDRIDLQTGERLYGFIMESKSDEVLLAVERQWLKATHPALFERYAAQELTDRDRSRKEMQQRIEDWIDQRQDDAGFQRYLQFKLDQLGKEHSAAPESFFMLLQLSRDQVKLTKSQPPDRRQIAGIAYQHDLTDVVTTPTVSLLRQLDDLKIDPTKESVDLSKKLPSSIRQTERQWAARKALVEFERYKRVEYQGTGNSFYKSGDQVDIAQIVPQMLQNNSLDAISQLGAELGLPEFQQLDKSNDSGDDWWRSIVKKEEAAGVRGVLIKRLKQGMMSERVEVECHFFARDDDNQWFEVVQFSSQASAGQTSAADREELENDPQVSQALTLLKSLGIADNGRIQQAMSHGVATQQAIRDATQKMESFLGLYTTKLNGPSIPLSQ